MAATLTIRWPWDKPPHGGRARRTPWTRDQMRAKLERELFRRELVKAESAGDLLSILADAHFQAFLARNAVREHGAEAQLGKRDAMLVLNQANQQILAAMRQLGIYGASRDPRQPGDAPLEGDGLDFSPPSEDPKTTVQ